MKINGNIGKYYKHCSPYHKKFLQEDFKLIFPVIVVKDSIEDVNSQIKKGNMLKPVGWFLSNHIWWQIPSFIEKDNLFRHYSRAKILFKVSFLEKDTVHKLWFGKDHYPTLTNYKSEV